MPSQRPASCARSAARGIDVPTPPPEKDHVIATPARARIPSLDGLRGMAILLVLMIHFTDREAAVSLGNRIYTQVAGTGWIGVDLFFVLSGFLITDLLLEAKGAPGYFRNFYARRTLRIFPLYYATLALWFIAVPMFLRPTSTEGQALLDSLQADQAWYWAYLSNWRIGLDASWPAFGTSVYWSLAIEEQFYIVWPAVVFFSSRRVLFGICVGLIVVAFTARVVMAAAGFDPILIYVSTPTRMDALAVGALIAVTAKMAGGWASLTGVLRVAGPIALAALASIWVVIGRFSEFHPLMQTIGFTFVAIVFAWLLVRAVVSAPGSLISRLFTHRVLRFFGKYSYAMYLIHLTIRFELMPSGRGQQLLGSEVAGQLATFVVCLAVTVACAWVSWHLFEKHLLALKERFATTGAVESTPYGTLAGAAESGGGQAASYPMTSLRP